RHIEHIKLLADRRAIVEVPAKGMPVLVDENSQMKAVIQLMSQNRHVLGQPINLMAEKRNAARNRKT
ncbi:MAG: hypothetical protein HC938_04350, partial [Nitrospira sp.]|nr:hypothetical protein [Nitrospira sp.]